MPVIHNLFQYLIIFDNQYRINEKLKQVRHAL